MGFWYWFLLIVAVVFAWFRLRRRVFVIRQYETGLLYHEGRFEYATGPGREVFWNPNYQMTLVDLRRRQMNIAAQDLTTADQSTVRISLLMTFKVRDAVKAVHESQDYQSQLYAAAQMSAREVIATMNATKLIADPASASPGLLESVSTAAAALGLDVISLEPLELSPTNRPSPLEPAAELPEEQKQLLKLVEALDQAQVMALIQQISVTDSPETATVDAPAKTPKTPAKRATKKAAKKPVKKAAKKTAKRAAKTTKKRKK